MELDQILAAQFPGMENYGYEVWVSEAGQKYIGMWDDTIMGRTKPTPQEIASWTKPAAGRLKKNEFARRSIEDMDAVFADMELPPDKIIYELLQEALTNPRGAKTLAVQAARAKRQRGDDKVNSMLADPAATAEQITALRWEDQ